MIDKELVDKFFVQNREIKHELSLIEDVLKTLLVNNVLSDAEKIVSDEDAKNSQNNEITLLKKQNDKLQNENEELRCKVKVLENQLENAEKEKNIYEEAYKNKVKRMVGERIQLSDYRLSKCWDYNSGLECAPPNKGGQLYKIIGININNNYILEQVSKLHTILVPIKDICWI